MVENVRRSGRNKKREGLTKVTIFQLKFKHGKELNIWIQNSQVKQAYLVFQLGGMHCHLDLLHAVNLVIVLFTDTKWRTLVCCLKRTKGEVSILDSPPLKTTIKGKAVIWFCKMQLSYGNIKTKIWGVSC